MPFDIFPSARSARYESKNNLFIFREIRDIEEQIILAINAGKICIDVDTTDMTYYPSVDMHNMHSETPIAVDYYNVWKGNTEDAVKKDQMNTVIEYFKDMGYSIVRKLNTATNTTFYWELRW